MIRADRQNWRTREVSRLLALFEAERHYYKEIVSGLPNGLLVLSPDLRVVAANRRFLEILDLASENVLGRSLGDLLPVAGLPERVRKALASSTAERNMLLEAPGKEGVRLLLAGVSVLEPAEGSEDGQEKSVLLAVEDLTALGRLEMVPKGAEPRQPDLLDDLDAIIWERDAARLQFTYVNKRAEEIMGFPVKEWLADPEFWRKRIHPEDRELVMAFYKAAAAQGAPHECGYRALTADGRTLWLREIIGVTASAAGKPARLRGLMLDVTEHRLHQEQAVRSQKLEALERLAGRVAHDFNNLLMVITGYAQEIAGELKPGDPLREEALEIVSAADHAAALTRMLLTYARRQVVEPRNLDLSTFLKELEPKLRSALGESIELKLALDPGVGMIKADPAQIEQAITSLILNAKDAIPAHGEVSIRTSAVALRQAETAEAPDLAPGEYAMVTVRDTGRGMDRETQAHLFEPFFSTKEPGQRAGLGLAATYGIVKQSGGDIQVASAPGVGTTFRIYLPVSAAAAEAAAAAAPAPPPTERVAPPRETVLLVEEEGGIRALVRKILLRNGYKVLEAGDAEEAARLAGSYDEPLHLLVTDMVLPHMNGRELADKLAAGRPQMKTLYVFGYTDNDLALAAQLPEGAAYLQKPFSLDALLRKVKEALAPPSETHAASM